MIIFYQNTTGNLQTIGLMNGSAYANDATLKATLFNQAGTAIPDFTDIPGAYVDGSNGNYNFAVPTLNLPTGGGYSLIVTAATPDGHTRPWTIEVIVAGS